MAGYFIALGIVSILWPVECSSKYDNYTLIHLLPTSMENLEALFDFHDPENAVEILKSSRDVNDTFDILVPPQRYEFVKNFAAEKDVGFLVKQENYGRTLEEPVEDRVPRRRVLRSFNLYEYNSYANMLKYLDSAAIRHPDVITLQPLGNSYEGRRMTLVKISTNPRAGNPIIFVDAGIHAREWAAPAMALYLIHRLANDRTARANELNGVDWYILVLVNPDGYEFSRSSASNRMWRKTRSKSQQSGCFGVDGNRNYGFKWAVSGVSNDPCHQETYAGPVPFSEPETIMVKKIMMENSNRMKLYVSLHSYGQYLVYPWGYTGEYLPKQWRQLDALARAVSDAVQRAGGYPFKVMSAGKWYPAAGGSDDYAFGAAGVPYSYTMELTQGYEFSLPEHQLRKVLPEFYEGFKAFGAQIKREFGRP